MEPEQIVLNQDGGTGVNPASKVVPNGESVVTLPTAPTKSGYTFGGWWTGTNGSGASFTASTVVNGNITVYAKWTASYNPCAGVPAWNASDGYWTMTVGTKKVNGGKLWKVKDLAQVHWEPSGPQGSLGWTSEENCP